ncbi:MAG: hypothetical protein IID44_15285 [Planctomycetes bacterium]|nr:hypothetical protein [Planctomycetota bacterium]
MFNRRSKSDRSALPARKLWAFRLAALGVSFLIALAALAWYLIEQEMLVFDPETGAWRLQARPIYLYEPGHERTGHKYLYDSELGWRNIPNWKATTFGHQLTINSKGLRDREYEYDKPAGWRRILVLGDSFAWGYGVADEEIFTEVLEDRFEREGTKWQVINAGVSGWGTDQQLLYLQSEGLKYQPDVVVLAFYVGNDLTNNTQSIQYGLNKPLFLDLDLQLANVPVPKPPTDRTKLKRARVSAVRLTVRIIQEMEKECAAAGARLVVMKFGLFQVPDNSSARALDSSFTKRLEEHQGKSLFLDLDARFRDQAITKEELVEGNHDGHWNAHGHRVVADMLHEFLVKEKLAE